MKNLKNIFAIITLLITFNSYSQITINYNVCGEEQEPKELIKYEEFNPFIDTINIECDTIKFISTIYEVWLSNESWDFNTVDENRKANEDINISNTVYLIIVDNSNSRYRVIVKNTSPTASVDENKMNVSELIAFPNPAVNQITVKFETNKTNMPISVYSLTGALVYRNEDTRDFGRNELTIEVSGLAQGMYLIRVGDEKLTNEDGDVTNVFKFVKTQY